MEAARLPQNNQYLIQNAVYAVAIDEIREIFNVAPVQRQSDGPQPLHQVWFPGGHGCVEGGSKEESMLSDAADWMIDQIAELKLGLEFDRTKAEDGIHPDYEIDFDNTPEGIYVLGH